MPRSRSRRGRGWTYPATQIVDPADQFSWRSGMVGAARRIRQPRYDPRQLPPERVEQAKADDRPAQRPHHGRGYEQLWFSGHVRHDRARTAAILG